MGSIVVGIFYVMCDEAKYTTKEEFTEYFVSKNIHVIFGRIGRR